MQTKRGNINWSVIENHFLGVLILTFEFVFNDITVNLLTFAEFL